ncbi:maleylpyruvate isomerase family mycothiol-dependent enzyme [Sanguibacter sp. 25GB23B1]|uniref:maleylpyruvate isomerase family mycothiol-dependent enzyme n=1 Tax=unclassified Sanguibacter TaxID=2645534 RepID=UPI0032AF2BFA
MSGRSSEKARRDQHLWALAHAERAALADDLAGLAQEQWRHSTLCGDWDVEEVVAHLVAAASVGPWRWARSIVGARFRPDVHNQRRMLEHRGSTPAETLERFRSVVASTTAPSSHTPAYLGEVLVHAQDIRRPLGIHREPAVDALTVVADFYARRDFTVASKTHARGLQLRADDGPFAAGSGPLVIGSTLALVMSMAGRTAYLDELEGPGVPSLRQRLKGAQG